MSVTKIGITLGDPSGVGPEILATLLRDRGDALHDQIQIFGDRVILERAFIAIAGSPLPPWVPLLDRGRLSADQAVPGVPTQAGAEAQVGYLEAAVKAARAGDIRAIVTAPVSKAQCARAGFDFSGQTEFFANRLAAKNCAMMFVGPTINVVLVTVHVPLAQVPSLITAARISSVVELSLTALSRDLGITAPRVGVLGLNPHAGDGGLLGSEENEIITPAIRALALAFPNARFAGPLPPDSAFRMTDKFDLLVAMYHDQALAPLKVIDFSGSVNVTLGLPIVRTSPDHGVAYDIAGKGTADARPFASAFDCAARMISQKSPS